MKRLYSFALLATATAAALAATGSVETERYYLSGRDRGGAVRWRFMCTAGAQSGLLDEPVGPRQLGGARVRQPGLP